MSPEVRAAIWNRVRDDVAKRAMEQMRGAEDDSDVLFALAWAIDMHQQEYEEAVEAANEAEAHARAGAV